MTTITLSEIYIYPVKSFAGIKVDTWNIDEKGLIHDRKWMLIDDQQQFLSQRKLPRMSMIKTAIDHDRLIISIPEMEDISIPLNPQQGEQIETYIWRDQCTARLVSERADQLLSEFLQIPCRLVYQPNETKRKVDQKFASEDDIINFSDGFPFLLISQGSLAALNEAMDIPLPMSRFRPNLVVSGCDSYAEDYWRHISIANINFRLPKPCSRCAVTTVNPERATYNKEPLRTLNRLRKWKNGVYFGQNAIHDNPGVLSVGDTVRINQLGPQQPDLG
jgi:MOSC domain-containing protein